MSQPSIAELRAVCQPPAVIGRRSDEHWAGRLYMRGLSIYVTRIAVRWGLSADGVTVTMLVVGLAGAAALFLSGLWPAVAAFVGVQAYLLLDCVDGEVARWRHTESARGIYLDRISHYLVEAVLVAGLGWRAGGGNHTSWATWGLVGALAVILARIETDLVDAARAKSGRAVIGDEGATLHPRPLRVLRRAAGLLPLHRITAAVEASTLALIAAVVDRQRGDLTASRITLGVVVAVAVAVAVGHLISILASERLS